MTATPAPAAPAELANDSDTVVAPPSKPPRFIDQHKKAIAITAVSALLVIVGVPLGISAIVSVTDRANADAAYQSARKAAVAQYKTDALAQRAYQDIHTDSTDLAAQVTGVLAAIPAGQFLPVPLVDTLATANKALTEVAAAPAGKAAANPHPAGRPSSPQSLLQSETRRMKKLAKDQEAEIEATLTATNKAVAQSKVVLDLLNTAITGAAATDKVAAVPTITEDAAAVINAAPKAGQPEKDALNTAAGAAQDGVKQGAAPAPLLADYLVKAQSVMASHEKVLADENAAANQKAIDDAQQRGDDTYVDPGTGKKQHTPPSNNSGGKTPPATQPSSPGEPPASNGGNNPGPSHENLIDWGSKANGCPSGNIATYQHSAPYGGYVSVHDNYLTANFTDTGSGWTVTGTYCAD